MMSVNSSLNTAAPRGSQRGFTLIELMVALAIVAIIVTFGVPAYTQHVTKTKRAEATTMLEEVASRQEQFLADNQTYATDTKQLGYATNPAASKDGNYSVSILAATATCPINRCFVAQATPVAGSTQDGDGFFQIDSRGRHFWDVDNSGSIDAGEDTWKD